MILKTLTEILHNPSSSEQGDYRESYGGLMDSVSMNQDHDVGLKIGDESDGG
jgi:hypothetical protein